MTLSREEVDQFLQKAKKRGERTLSLLGKYKGFIDALNSDVGKELLADLVRDHEVLLDKISELTATEEDKMQYKVVRRMLMAWSTRINSFNELVKEIKTQ